LVGKGRHAPLGGGIGMSGQAEMAHNTWASPQHGMAVSRPATDVWTHAQEGEAMCYDMFGGWGHFIRWWW